MRASFRASRLALFTLLAAAPLAAQSRPTASSMAWRANVTPSFYADGVDTSPPQLAERNRGKGALWGGAVGLVAGGLLGAASVESDDDDGFGGSLVESAATGEAVVIGALVGAGLGALLGATVFAPTRTSTSSNGAMAIRVSPESQGEETGVRIGFLWRR